MSSKDEVFTRAPGIAWREEKEARQEVMEALEEEVADYIERHRGERDESGHSYVVRNGRCRSRKITMGSGTVEEMADMIAASRSFQLNAEMANTAKSMMQRLLTLGQ